MKPEHINDAGQVRSRILTALCQRLRPLLPEARQGVAIYVLSRISDAPLTFGEFVRLYAKGLANAGVSQSALDQALADLPSAGPEDVLTGDQKAYVVSPLIMLSFYDPKNN